MSWRSTVWSSWAIFGYWLHIYTMPEWAAKSMPKTEPPSTKKRIGIAIESDRSGCTYMIWGVQ